MGQEAPFPPDVMSAARTLASGVNQGHIRERYFEYLQGKRGRNADGTPARFFFCPPWQDGFCIPSKSA